MFKKIFTLGTRNHFQEFDSDKVPFLIFQGHLPICALDQVLYLPHDLSKSFLVGVELNGLNDVKLISDRFEWQILHDYLSTPYTNFVLVADSDHHDKKIMEKNLS